MPQLLAHMRAHGRQQLHQHLGNPGRERLLVGRCRALLGAALAQVVARRVSQLHDGGDGGIEIVAVEVVDHLAGHAMTLAQQHLAGLGDIGIARTGLEQRVLAGLARQVVDHAPCAVEELVHAGQAVLVPLQFLVGRGHEQDVGAHRVGAVTGNHILGGNDVALRLAHDVAVLVKHHALAQQVLERLVKVHQPQIAQHLGEEAAVKQVQDGMLDAANVLIDRHPAVHLFGVERRLGVMRVGVAQVVPARARERVHRVRFAAGGLAALRARALRELLVRSKRFTCRKVDILGQADRQVLLGDGHHAAIVAVNHRDGVAPVALAGNQPIAQAELHLALAAAGRLQVGDDGRLALGMLAARKPRVLAGLHQHALGLHGRFPVNAGDDAVLLAIELGEQRVALA